MGKKVSKKDYTPIQLLANKPILDWWKENAENGERQEMLRQAVIIGIEVLQGKLVTVDPGKSQIYEAIETLLKSGIIPQPEKEKETTPVVASGGKKKPKISKIRQAYQEARLNG